MKNVPHPYRTITACINVPNEFAADVTLAIGSLLQSLPYPFTIGDVPSQVPKAQTHSYSDQGGYEPRCVHDRLDEDGICRACGADCRGTG